MYYAKAECVADYQMQTEDLNDPDAIESLLSWVGVSDPVIDIKHTNKGPQ
jgi:hypothetical protein